MLLYLMNCIIGLSNSMTWMFDLLPAIAVPVFFVTVDSDGVSIHHANTYCAAADYALAVYFQ